MTRNADVTAAAEIDDGNFDAELLPDRVLQRVGHGAGFVRFCRRKWHVSHAAVPGRLVGNNRVKLSQLDESAAGVLGEPMRSCAECFEADSLEEVNCCRNG